MDGTTSLDRAPNHRHLAREAGIGVAKGAAAAGRGCARTCIVWVSMNGSSASKA